MKKEQDSRSFGEKLYDMYATTHGAYTVKEGKIVLKKFTCKEIAELREKDKIKIRKQTELSAVSKEKLAIIKGIPTDRLREIAEAERDGCVYRQVYEDEAVFECSHCGATWCYECGSPIENEQHFCGRCGRPIKSLTLLERDENYELIEVEKSMAYKPVGICSGCVHRGDEICASCVRNGRGNDVDFYSKEKEK